MRRRNPPAAWLVVLLLACGAEDPVAPEPQEHEWVSLTAATGDAVNIAVLRPSVAASVASSFLTGAASPTSTGLAIEYQSQRSESATVEAF